MNSTVSSRHRKLGTWRSATVISAYWVLAVITLFNLNGLGQLGFGVEQLFSPLILACCLVLITALAKISLQQALGIPGFLILSALTSYLVIGGLIGFLKGLDSRPEFHFYLLAYFKSIVVIAAAAFGSCALIRRIGVERLLKTLLMLLILSSATIAISSSFGYAYLITPESNAFRFAGFFQNPNQAGLFGCLTLVLALSFLSFNLNRKMAYVALTLAALVIFGSFSRGAIFVLIVVFAWILVKSVPARKAVTKWLIVMGAMGLIAWMTTDLNFMRLEEKQIHRIRSVVSVFGQEGFHDGSWSKRVVLMNLALEEVLASPILGNGLGRLHRLENAPYLNPQGEPQGAHNQYLIFAGESGIVPLLFLLLFLAHLFLRPRTMQRSVATMVVAGWSLVFALFLLTSHSALTLRYGNFVIGLSCALVSVQRSKAERVM